MIVAQCLSSLFSVEIKEATVTSLIKDEDDDRVIGVVANPKDGKEEKVSKDITRDQAFCICLIWYDVVVLCTIDSSGGWSFLKVSKGVYRQDTRCAILLCWVSGK